MLENDYDEALKWAIQEVIDNIMDIHSLDTLRLESIHYSLFGKEIEERWEEYKRDCQV